jgi:hypothetical protein
VTNENQEERGIQIDVSLKRETREKEKSQLNILQLSIC